MDAVAFLETVPLFAELEPAHLAEIARHTRPFECPAGTTLFRQGDAGEDMYVIASGNVLVTTRLLGENKVALTHLGPGDLLGELALIDGRMRSATARCVEATSGLYIRRTHFAMLRADLHPAALRLMRSLGRMLAARQRAFIDQIAELNPPANISAHPRSIPPPPFDDPFEVQVCDLNPAFFRTSPLFAAFADAKRSEFLASMKAWAVPRGRVICEKGQAGASCFFTVRGAVRIALLQGQGAWSETIAIVGPGRVFGHQCLVDDEPRSAACIVRENAIILELRREVFEAWCDSRNPLAFDVLEIVTVTLVDELRASGGLMARFAVEGRVRQRVQTLTLPADQVTEAARRAREAIRVS